MISENLMDPRVFTGRLVKALASLTSGYGPPSFRTHPFHNRLIGRRVRPCFLNVWSLELLPQESKPVRRLVILEETLILSSSLIRCQTFGTGRSDGILANGSRSRLVVSLD